jgi:hypothetical protein
MDEDSHFGRFAASPALPLFGGILRIALVASKSDFRLSKSSAPPLNVRELFAVVAVFSAAIAFESPAAAALLPGVAPKGMLCQQLTTQPAL